MRRIKSEQSAKCLLCKATFPKPIIKNRVIDGAYAFHMWDTHGIPKELLPEFISSILRGLNGKKKQ